MDTSMLCDECRADVENDPDRLDLDSITAVRRELADSVNSTSEHTGLHAERGADRAIAASRIAWLASRLAWLESCDLLSAELAAPKS